MRSCARRALRATRSPSRGRRAPLGSVPHGSTRSTLRALRSASPARRARARHVLHGSPADSCNLAEFVSLQASCKRVYILHRASIQHTVDPNPFLQYLQLKLIPVIFGTPLYKLYKGITQEFQLQNRPLTLVKWPWRRRRWCRWHLR